MQCFYEKFYEHESLPLYLLMLFSLVTGHLLRYGMYRFLPSPETQLPNATSAASNLPLQSFPEKGHQIFAQFLIQSLRLQPLEPSLPSILS